MRRRDLLRTAGLVPLVATSFVKTSWGLAHQPFRRCRPGDPGWPAPADWEALKAVVKGNLLRPAPLLAPCMASGNESPECKNELELLRNPYYIGDQPSGTQVSGWLDAWSPASSEYVVVAHNSADVVAGVNFARRHRLRLVVKGGGHSYQGTSNAADSLLIWTRPMNRIEVHQEFTPRKCGAVQGPTTAVTVDAGAVWMDVYDAVTTKAGRYVQGGGCATVGVAGLVQSGGFGSFSKTFGTASGSLLEAEVVTADGATRVVNPMCDPELFWALKGGGGGSFGVVTRLTLRTHDLPEFFGGADGTIRASSSESFKRLLGRFVEFYAGTLFNSHWGESVSIRPDNTLKISMVCAGLTPGQAEEIWKPFFQWVSEAEVGFTWVEEAWAGAHPARRWWDVQLRKSEGSTSLTFDARPNSPPSHAWWTGDQEQVGAFLHGYESVWLPDILLSSEQRPSLVSALFEASRSSAVELHFNKGLAGAPPDAIGRARHTAMNPAALSAFALAIIAAGGSPRYPGFPGSVRSDVDARKDAGAVRDASRALIRLVPKPGSYVSESNYFNENWSDAFWGSQYGRLSRAKMAYDPEGLFFVHHGVGSERWSADGFVRLD